MNDRRRRNDMKMRIGVVMCVACGFMLMSASAWSGTRWLDDPLDARPPTLDLGESTLPGDQRPVLCPDGALLDHPLALGEVVDLALCNSPQIKAAWATIKLQSGVLGEARAAYLPTVSVTMSELQTRTQYPGDALFNSTVTGHTGFVGFNWRIFDFGARAANRKAANQSLVAALASRDAAVQKTLAVVVGAYFDALAARAANEARTESSELARKTLSTTFHRQQLGAVGRSDVLQATTALAKATLDEQRANQAYVKSLAMLVYDIGLPVNRSIDLARMPAVRGADSVGDLDAWLREATEAHPAIFAARSQWDASRAKIDQVRAEGRPTIDFSANLYQNGYPNQGLQPQRSNVSTIGVTLTIPLFEGFARQYKIQQAAAQAEQSSVQFDDTVHQIQASVIKAHADAASALANLDTSEKLLDTARASVESSTSRYTKGAADIVELLSTEKELSDALQERARCVSEWHSARLQLMGAAGVLGRDAIEN
ncbi:TolC family protein [Burkholderia sp. AW33-5]